MERSSTDEGGGGGGRPTGQRSADAAIASARATAARRNPWFADLLPGATVADAFESQAQGYLVEKCLKYSEDAATTLRRATEAATASVAKTLRASSMSSASSAAATMAAEQTTMLAVDGDPWNGARCGLRRLAFPLWVRDVGELRKVLDAVARRQFARSRKVEEVAVYYAALGRKVALAQL